MDIKTKPIYKIKSDIVLGIEESLGEYRIDISVLQEILTEISTSIKFYATINEFVVPLCISLQLVQHRSYAM